MQIVELASVILTLAMEILVDVIFVQPLKAISREMTARPGFHGFVIAKKLHCLAIPIHLRVLVLTS